MVMVKTIYVSNDGKDTNDGCSTKPFRTLKKAASVLKKGDTLIILPGTYRETLFPPSEVSVIGMGKTIFSGGDIINKRFERYKDNIYFCDVTDIPIDDFERCQVFVDSEMMIEARWPKLNDMKNIMEYKRAVAKQGTNRNGISDTELVPVDLTGARVTVWPGEEGVSGWLGFTRIIAKSLPGRLEFDREIYMKDDLTNKDSYSPHAGNPYLIQGSLNLLSKEGEYFLDYQGRKLYIIFPQGKSPNECTVEIKSSRKIAVNLDDCKNVHVKGLVIYGAGLSMKDSTNCKLEECKFLHMEHFKTVEAFESTKSNLYMYMSGNGNIIKKCSFGITCGNGLYVEGSNHLIENCIFHETGYSGAQFAGVYFGPKVKNCIVRKNTFVNSGRVHIYATPGGELINCLIEFNHFKDHAIFTSDCGAFYTWKSNGKKTEIRYNYVESTEKGDNGSHNKYRMGIYLDNYCYDYSIHHNLIINLNFTGIQLNLPCTGTMIYNNTTVKCGCGIGMYGYPKDNADMTGTEIFDNIFSDSIRGDYCIDAAEEGEKYSYTKKLDSDGVINVIFNKSRKPVSKGNLNIFLDEQYLPIGFLLPENLQTSDAKSYPGYRIPGRPPLEYGADWVIDYKEIKPKNYM